MSEKPKKKRTLGGCLVTAVLIIIAIVIGRFAGSTLGRANAERMVAEQTSGEPDAAIAQGFEQAAETIRAGLPKKIDDFTTMTDVQVENGGMHYFLTLDVDLPEDQLETARIETFTGLQSQICGSENTKPAIDAGSAFTWTYTLPDGRQFTVIVDRCGDAGPT